MSTLGREQRSDERSDQAVEQVIKQATEQEAYHGVNLEPLERTTLFLDSGLSQEYVLGLPLITFDLVRQHCASADHVRAANLSVVKLRRMGASTAGHLRQLGFDATDLRNEGFCVQVVNEYGEKAVQQAFLDTASNVRKVAGSNAMDVLKLSVNWMVSECKNDPVNASGTLRNIIKYLGVESTLTQLAMPTLVETGLTSVELARLGVTVDYLTTCMHATDDDLRTLKYTFRMK